MNYDNTLACMSWLEYLNIQGKKGILGTLNDNVFKAALLYNVGIPYMSYIAEFPLSEKAGVDLSAVYPLEELRHHNIFLNHPAEADGEQLQQYARFLHQLNPSIVSDSHFFLEIDSSKDKPNSYGLFIELAGNYVPLLLPQVLAAQKLSYCLKTAVSVLEKAVPHLGLWYVGFMHSRPNEPLRLSLVTVNNDLEDLVKAAETIGLNDFLASAKDTILRLKSMNLFASAYFSIDILKDGSLGDVIGVDLHPGGFNPKEQIQQLSSPKYREFYNFVKELGIADERIDYVKDLVFANEMKGNGDIDVELYSILSHFKFKWKKDQLLPLKVYLQMKAYPKQRNLNEVF